jgi:hypothetical protein
MKKLIIAACFAGVGLAGISPSQALPLVLMDQARAGVITLVAGGCGIGLHRGPYGGCRVNEREVVVVPAAPVVVAPVVAPVVVARPCPLGMHLGPYGHRCFVN